MIESPEVSQKWLDKDEKQRISIIEELLEENLKFSSIKIFTCADNGHVEICLPESIKVGKRGLYLLDFEEFLKNRVEKGLTVWCEPLGDKNSLRKLRGIQIK
jgi:hypothetical protein